MENNITLKEYIKEKIAMSGFTQPERNKIIDGLSDNISLELNVAVLEKLNEEEKKEFLTLCQLKNGDDILKYASSKIANFDELMGQIAEKTCDEFNMITKK